MMITAAGGNKFMQGSSSVNQYSVTSSGAISLASFGTNYGSALHGDGSYRTDSTGQRLKALERIMQYSHAHIIEEGYNEVVRSARANEEIITQAVTASAVDFDPIWTAHGAVGGVADELKAIAKLIGGRECLGNNRQIFTRDSYTYVSNCEVKRLDNAVLPYRN